MILNPFASVSGERYQVIEGRTPEIAILQARALLAPFETASLVGLRDRALFGTLCYTGTRLIVVINQGWGIFDDRRWGILNDR